MTCEQVKQLLPEWLDGEVDAMRAKKIEGHIATCPSCRREAAFWQEVRAALQEEGQELTAPAGFAAGVLEALPEKGRRPRQGLVSRWKRGIAAAAAFLLVAAGSAGAYFNWGLNTASHVAENGSKTPGFVSVPEDPGTMNPDTGQNQSPDTGGNNDSNAGKTPQENGKTPGATGDNEGNKDKDTKNNDSTSGNKEDTGSEQYVFCSADLDAEKERAARHTLLKVKVYDIEAARTLAVKHINQAGGSYEALGADPAGGESLKITVNENRSGALLANLKNLGRVVTENTQVDNISERYREKVEMYRTLAAQVQAAGDPQEQAQLETKLKAIEAQLLAWEKEAQRDTIILWLEE